MRLDGKTAIVTGGGRGIGFATAERLCKEGARVMIGEINQDLGRDAANALKEQGHKVSFVKCDISDPAAAEELALTTLSEFGGLDILINNAGITHVSDFLETDIEEFDAVIRVNLRGVFVMTQVAARHMIKLAAHGSIVNISSVTALLGMPDQVGYCASKAGVFQITRSIALALADKGIRVNAIGPGTVDTEMSAELLSYQNNPEFIQRILARTPLGRLATADDIANAVLFLAGDDSTYLTGHTVFVDGGRMVQNIVLPFDG